MDLGELSSRDSGDPRQEEPTNLEEERASPSEAQVCRSLRCVPYSFQHKSREPSDRPPALGPTANQVADPPAPTRSGTHVTGAGTPERLVPECGSLAAGAFPLGPPLCHPSSFSRTAVANEDPRATVPVPRGLAWSAPPPDSARVLAQTPPLPRDHAPLWVQPTGCTSNSSTLPVSEKPLGTFLVSRCAQVSRASVICQQNEESVQRTAERSARTHTHAHTPGLV